MTSNAQRPLPADDALADVTSLEALGRVFFCGIGGAGMSVLAQMLHQAGVSVSGSDRVATQKTDHLASEGVAITIGQSAENIHDVDTVVWSSAIPQTSPEIQAALSQGLRLAHRSDILALLLKTHRSIAVAGTHGKTTTSSMLATISRSLDSGDFADASFAIGGSIKTLGGQISGGFVGAGSWMVAEADESDGSFEKYRPTIAVITNAEGDHLDHYLTVEKYRRAFVSFAEHATYGVVLCGDDEGAREVFSLLPDVVAARTVIYSTEEPASLVALIPGGVRGAAVVHIGQATEIADDGDSSEAVEERLTVEVPARLAQNGPSRVDLALQVPGLHNARNAASALCAAAMAGVPLSQAQHGLSEFLGAARRFDFQGEVRGVRLYNDYAHHPTEVSVLLDAMRRRFPGRTLRVLFQPHTYSRTKIYTRELIEALQKADDVVLTSLFAARELPSDYPGISSQTLLDEAQREGAGKRFELIDDMHEGGRALAHRSVPGDVIVTVGGGDIDLADSSILTALRSQE